MNCNQQKIMALKTSVGRAWRLATLKTEVKGKFTRWRAGDVVRVSHLTHDRYIIERVRWRGTLPILNQCVNVPRLAFEFNPA